jgi:hypothetical protein
LPDTTNKAAVQIKNQSESEIFRFDDPGGMERRQHEQHDPQHDRERGEQRVAPTCLEARKARLDAWVNHQHLPPLPRNALCLSPARR